MNFVARCGALAVALALPWAGLHAQEAATPAAGWSVTAECQMLVLPQKLALAVMPGLLDDDAFDKEWEGVKAKIQKGEIKLAADVIVAGEAGKKLQSDTGEEFRYPIEFNPPDLPHNIPEKKAEELLKMWPAITITPTAFETRALGASATVTAAVSPDGQWVSAEVKLQDVRFIRSIKYDAGVLASGEHLGVEQPQFYSAKSELSVQMRSGWWQVVGSHVLPGDEGMEVFLLRLSAKRAGSGK
jgi:hypothetical protein